MTSRKKLNITKIKHFRFSAMLLVCLLFSFVSTDAIATFTQDRHQAHGPAEACGSYENNSPYVVTLYDLDAGSVIKNSSPPWTDDGTAGGGSLGTLYDKNNVAVTSDTFKDYPYYDKDGYVRYNPPGNPNTKCASPHRSGSKLYSDYHQDKIYEMYEQDVSNPGQSTNSFFDPRIRVDLRYCIGVPVFYPTCSPSKSGFYGFPPPDANMMAAVALGAMTTGSNIMYELGSCWKWACAGGMISGHEELTVNQCAFVGKGSIVRFCARPAEPGIKGQADYKGDGHNANYNSLGNRTAIDPDYRGVGQGNRFAGPIFPLGKKQDTKVAIELSTPNGTLAKYLVVVNGVVTQDTAYIYKRGEEIEVTADIDETNKYKPGGTAYAGTTLVEAYLKSTHKEQLSTGGTRDVSDKLFLSNGRVVNPRVQLCAFEDSGDGMDMAASKIQPFHHHAPNPKKTGLNSIITGSLKGDNGELAQGIAGAGVYFAGPFMAATMAAFALTDAITATFNHVVPQNEGCIDFTLGPYPPVPLASISGVKDEVVIMPICQEGENPNGMKVVGGVEVKDTENIEHVCACPAGETNGKCTGGEYNTFEKPKVLAGASKVDLYCTTSPLQNSTISLPCICPPGRTSTEVAPCDVAPSGRIAWELDNDLDGSIKHTAVGIRIGGYRIISYGFTKDVPITSNREATLEGKTYFLAMDNPMNVCLYRKTKGGYCTRLPERTPDPNIVYADLNAGCKAEDLNAQVGSCAQRIPVPLSPAEIGALKITAIKPCLGNPTEPNSTCSSHRYPLMKITLGKDEQTITLGAKDNNQCGKLHGIQYCTSAIGEEAVYDEAGLEKNPPERNYISGLEHGIYGMTLTPPTDESSSAKDGYLRGADKLCIDSDEQKYLVVQTLKRQVDTEWFDLDEDGQPGKIKVTESLKKYDVTCTGGYKEAILEIDPVTQEIIIDPDTNEFNEISRSGNKTCLEASKRDGTLTSTGGGAYGKTKIVDDTRVWERVETVYKQKVTETTKIEDGETNLEKLRNVYQITWEAGTYPDPEPTTGSVEHDDQDGKLFETIVTGINNAESEPYEPRNVTVTRTLENATKDFIATITSQIPAADSTEYRSMTDLERRLNVRTETRYHADFPKIPPLPSSDIIYEPDYDKVLISSYVQGAPMVYTYPNETDASKKIARQPYMNSKRVPNEEFDLTVVNPQWEAVVADRNASAISYVAPDNNSANSSKIAKCVGVPGEIVCPVTYSRYTNNNDYKLTVLFRWPETRASSTGVTVLYGTGSNGLNRREIKWSYASNTCNPDGTWSGAQTDAYHRTYYNRNYSSWGCFVNPDITKKQAKCWHYANYPKEWCPVVDANGDGAPCYPK